MVETNSKNKLRALIFLTAAVLLSACGHAATPAPTPDMSAYSTAAVQTVEARYTQTAAAIPTETPEPEEFFISQNIEDDFSLDEFEAENDFETYDPNFQPEVVFYTSEGDIAPAGSAASDTTQNAGDAVDKASWQSQSPADNTHMDPGAEFDITWNLLNTGTTTWTTGYRLRYFTGTNLTKPGKNYYLTSSVAPNAVGACTMDAVAPWQSGTYTMSVVLSNEEDKNFYVVDITIVVD